MEHWPEGLLRGEQHLNDMIPTEPAPEPEMQEVVLDRAQMLTELLNFCNGFKDKSAEWRRNSFEDSWRRWQRNADSIYDPDIAAKKQKWQSKAVWPITASHRENAQAQLFKTEVGPRPAIEIKARKGIALAGQMDQSEAIRDLIIREREKSRYELNRNRVIEDKTTYGSGFARLRFEEVIEDREVRIPDFESANPITNPMGALRHLRGQPQQVGEHMEVQPQIVYRGCRFEHLSIWDIFPDPKALQIKGNAIAYRYDVTYGDIKQGVEDGYNVPECMAPLAGISSAEDTPLDKQTVDYDRKVAQSRIERPDYAKKVRCYELFARLPKKWVLINGEAIDDPEKLIPAVVRFHESTVIYVGLNKSYDGEPEIYKDDYMPVAGQFYGRGVPEMLKDVQLVSSETINQRLDCGSIGLMQKFAVIEKAVVDTKDFDENRNVIRLKAPSGLALTDIKQVLTRLDMGTPDRASFVETQEWERIAQERTSVNRMTLGTAGQVKDSNQTLGGQQLLLQATGDKMAYLGMLSEFDFQYEVNRAYWKLIYKNYRPEDVAIAIGEQRAAQFQFMTPEQVENGYQYLVMGIFTTENKAQRQSRLAAIDAQFGMMPYFNRLEILRAELSASDEEPEKFIIPEADAVQIMMKAQEQARGMAAQMVAQSQMGPNGSRMPQDGRKPMEEMGVANGQ